MDWQNAIFAPGWVWSLLSLVLVVGSVAGLYRQLRLQHSQGAVEQLDAFKREWYAERLLSYRLNVLVALHDGTARPMSRARQPRPSPITGKASGHLPGPGTSTESCSGTRTAARVRSGGDTSGPMAGRSGNGRKTRAHT